MKEQEGRWELTKKGGREAPFLTQIPRPSLSLLTEHQDHLHVSVTHSPLRETDTILGIPSRGDESQ